CQSTQSHCPPLVHRRSRVETKMHCVNRRTAKRNCRASASWRFGIGLEPVAARCLTLDRQAAEFRVRVAVLNGCTALGIPVTKVAG
ncbi:MAG: hypothetical protein K2X91_17320, partial [Thermoleophilia bacterium]|nr:hypothetical protein [Thermoleophilia bacterium]